MALTPRRDFRADKRTANPIQVTGRATAKVWNLDRLAVVTIEAQTGLNAMLTGRTVDVRDALVAAVRALDAAIAEKKATR